MDAIYDMTTDSFFYICVYLFSFSHSSKMLSMEQITKELHNKARLRTQFVFQSFHHYS